MEAPTVRGHQELHDQIEAANKIYASKKIALIRRLKSDNDEDEFDLDYRGNILDVEGNRGKPIALACVATRSPESFLEIVDDNPQHKQISYGTLEELAGYVSFSEGRAGLIWSNAGQVVILSGRALTSAAQRYANNQDRIVNGGPSKQASTRILYEQCSSVPAATHPTLGRLYDWLKACRPGWSEESEVRLSQEPNPPGSAPSVPTILQPPRLDPNAVTQSPSSSSTVPVPRRSDVPVRLGPSSTTPSQPGT